MEYPNYSKREDDEKSHIHYEKFAPDSSPKKHEPKENSMLGQSAISK